MDRSLAAAAGTGSLSSVLLHFIAKAATEAPAIPFEACAPCVPLPEHLDLWTLGLGIFLGLLLGPTLEVAYWLHLAWRRAVFRWLQSAFRPPLVLYKVHEQ